MLVESQLDEESFKQMQQDIEELKIRVAKPVKTSNEDNKVPAPVP